MDGYGLDIGLDIGKEMERREGQKELAGVENRTRATTTEVTNRSKRTDERVLSLKQFMRNSTNGNSKKKMYIWFRVSGFRVRLRIITPTLIYKYSLSSRFALHNKQQNALIHLAS